jgi:hypothetical protein
MLPEGPYRTAPVKERASVLRRALCYVAGHDWRVVQAVDPIRQGLFAHLPFGQLFGARCECRRCGVEDGPR